MGIEVKLGDNIVTASLSKLVNWARKNSIWPVTFGLACCALEMMVTSSAHYDIARFGAEVFRPSPRQADLMIVSGTVTKKMAPMIKRIYEQMPDPKWVIAYGACACSGACSSGRSSASDSAAISASSRCSGPSSAAGSISTTSQPAQRSPSATAASSSTTSGRASAETTTRGGPVRRAPSRRRQTPAAPAKRLAALASMSFR